MHSQTRESDLLTPGEFGDRLIISKATVLRRVRLKKVAAVRLPFGHLRIPRSELVRLVREGSTIDGSKADGGA